MVAAADTDNIIEDNEIVGNANGIFLTAGVQGNTIRRNTILGNPPVQVAVDHTTNSGFDIKNMADASANTFAGNVCGTSINAPCPSTGPSLTANPNPIPVTANALVGVTTITWNAPYAQVIEIRIGSPNGTLLTTQGNRGSIQTGLWVSDGTTFYLQDVTDGKPLNSDSTLATVVLHLQRGAGASFHLWGGPRQGPFGAPAILVVLALCGIVIVQSGSRGKRVRIALGSAMLLAGFGFSLSQTMVLAQTSQTSPPSASSSASGRQAAATLDRMTSAGTSPNELAQYVFNAHGCKNCHTIGRDGKLGFTAKGKERAQGFEGCIRMLTAMTVIVGLPDNKRSPQQRQKAKRFEDFGCTACHKLAPGKLELTEVGAKLERLHLGCIDVEKLVASRNGPQN